MPTVNVSVDPVELELVRADIAMEKARLKANGDWSKWEEPKHRPTPCSRPILRPLIGGRGNASYCGGHSKPSSYRG
jgi:prepilin-type processing-associated H-X9-DG protein